MRRLFLHWTIEKFPLNALILERKEWNQRFKSEYMWLT